MKRSILQRLRHGGYVSGQELGQALNISRTAIWKYINELRREGYHIDSSPRRGYRLITIPDIPLPEEVKAGLNTRVIGTQVVFNQEVTSTQEIARSLASQNASEGTVVIAETQTAGKGRVGRSFASPPGGVYLSVILRPRMSPTEALRLPLIAGVAVARAVSTFTTLEPKLKWPNDIIVNGKKVGGILTEMSSEVDRVDFVVIGIGLNANTPVHFLPDEIRNIASSLLAEQGEPVSKVKLVINILTELELMYESFLASGFGPVREQWLAFSNTIGRWIKASSATGELEGKAIDLGEDGALLLQKADGTVERIIAGDIFLKKMINE